MAGALASLVVAGGVRLSSSPHPQLTMSPAATPGWSDGISGTYVGSEACASCHDEEYSQWKAALHLQMTKPIAETTVLGDFDGATVSAHGRTHRMTTRDGRYFVSVSHGGRPAEEFEVHYTLGALRFQGYLSRLPDGRVYVLPVFWHRDAQRWLDWKETTPVPDAPEHDLRQIWNVTCFNCHATNLSKNFDAASRTYDSDWTEMGIGCEACHGPGGAHAELMREWEENPALRQAYDATRDEGDRSPKLRIFSARTASRRQVFDMCAYCHGNKDNTFVGFVPGDRFEDFALPFLVSQPIPDNDPQGDFWPDGRPSRFNRPQALTLSGCFEKSDITCTTCHAAHGSKNEHSLKLPMTRSNLLCTQCHKTFEPSPEAVAVAAGPDEAPGVRVVRAALESWDRDAPSPLSLEKPTLAAHTFHPPGSPGSQCVNCHMSDVNWRLLMRRRDHTFQAPVPEVTARYGAPNACTECHDDRSPEWAAGIMDAWYGDGARRARTLTLAEVMYEAGSGNVEVLPRLAQVAVDRSHGAAIRAGAAEFIERLIVRARAGDFGGSRRSAAAQTSIEGSPRPVSRDAVSREPDEEFVVPPYVANALIGAATDPEPMVRTTAVRALGAVGEERLVPPLAARLVDSARLVRVAAAEALLNLGIVRLEGPAGVALARAQEEYATSLRTFTDVADDHVALGWLQMQRGAQAEARSALHTALGLEPESLRPRVLLGIIAARNEDFDEALEHWREVRRRDRSYPNIDRLIAEAERRRSGPGPR